MTDPVPADSFTFASEPELLGSMRSWLRQQLAGHGLPRRDESALVVAAAELCTNSIRHAYSGAKGQPIRVRVETFEDRVVIEVEDFGKAFNVAEYVAPDLDSMPEHGLGLYLVKQIADRLSFDVAREHGTRWTLVKFWRRRGAGPPAAGAAEGSA